MGIAVAYRMPHADFVHLRVHSAYSLSEGAIRVGELASLARAASMPAVAITDTGNLFGALEFSDACAKVGVQPVVGCQIGIEQPARERGAPGLDQLVLLAQDERGLANLRQLSTAGFLHSDPSAPAVTLDALCARSEGLFLLTGGVSGPVGRLLGEGQEAEARRVLARLAEAFADRIAVELQRHGLASEQALEPGLISLADASGLPLVATNECFFSRPDMYEAHDALLCIAQGRTLAETERRRASPEHWFKDATAMRAVFADLPEACDNTLAIARRCSSMAEGCRPLLPICPKVRVGETEAQTLRAMALEGLARRLAAMAVEQGPYRERLDFELGVIEAMGFSGYFLIVADFIQWAKGQGIAVGPGRGVGGGVGRGLGVDDHRHRSVAVRASVRAVP